MPPPNERRRAQLADAAIDLLVAEGVHGVTHRAVDRRAGLPAGTASNYFRSREALLVATARRVVEQHRAEMTAAGGAGAVDLIADSLLLAAGPHRARYLAVFELRLESLRRPALATAIDELMAGMAAFTGEHHAKLALAIPPAAVPAMLVLYGGALFALVTGPAAAVTPDAVRPLAVAIVEGGRAAASA